MNEDPESLKRLDFAAGVPIAEFAGADRLLGHVGKEEVLVVRGDGKLFAIGAHCTHYHAPLVDGLIVGKEIRCPWHHARFDVSNGEAKAAPAFDALGCWNIEQRGEQIFVTSKRTSANAAGGRVFAKLPQKIVIIGGGAAGFAAAERLRRENYAGSLTIVSAENSAPVRQTEPLQGLSGRNSSGRLAAAAPLELLPRRRHRSADRRLGNRSRQPIARDYALGRLKTSLRTSFARHGSRTREITPARLGSATCFHLAIFGGLPLHHQAGGSRAPRFGDGRKLYRT